MNNGDCLLREILKRPDDDTARLVYADWLMEHGDRKRGEFIRGQVEAARAGVPCPREVWDLMPSGFEWLGLRPPEEFEIGWERGFVDWVVSPRRYVWNPKRLRRLFGQHPITSVELLDVFPEFVNRDHRERCGWWPGGWSTYGQVSERLFGRLPDGDLFLLTADFRLDWFLEYPDEDAARAALRTAVTSFGRSLVGLPSRVYRQKEKGVDLL